MFTSWRMGLSLSLDEIDIELMGKVCHVDRFIGGEIEVCIYIYGENARSYDLSRSRSLIFLLLNLCSKRFRRTRLNKFFLAGFFFFLKMIILCLDVLILWRW